MKRLTKTKTKTKINQTNPKQTNKIAQKPRIIGSS